MFKLEKKQQDDHRYEIDETAKTIRGLFADLWKVISQEICPGLKLLGTLTDKYVECKKKFFILNCEEFVRSADIPDEKVKEFLETLSEEKEQWLVTFVLDSLYADDEHKSQIYGYLFKELVNTKDFATYRRLVRAVKNTFLDDLSALVQYKERYLDYSDVGQTLANVGLVKEVRHSVGVFGSEDLEEEAVKYKVTELGMRLLTILENNKWCG